MNQFTGSQVDTGENGVQDDPSTSFDNEISLSNAFSDKASAESSEDVIEEEVAVEPEKVESSEDAKFASKFAALSRKEREIRQKEVELQSKNQQLEQRLMDLEARLNPPEPEKPKELPLEMRLRKDPLATLTELGIPYEKLTDIVLNDGKIPNDLKMEVMRREMEEKYNGELESLRNDLLSDKQGREEEKYKQVIQNFMGELTSFINDDESYEMIRANDSVDLVYNIIEEHYNETGRVLDKREAADHVESYLLERAKKLMSLKKLQPVSEEPKEPVKIPSQSPTLSNTMSSQVSTSKEKFLSDDESKAAVAALLKWND